MPIMLMFKTITSSLTDTKKTPKTSDNSNFLTSEAKLVFLQLRQAFTKALILHHFNLESYIRIEIDTFGNAIDSILSQLTSEFD